MLEVFVSADGHEPRGSSVGALLTVDPLGRGTFTT